MLKHISTAILLLIIGFISSACSGASSAQVIRATPVSRVVPDEALEYRNCEGQTDLSQSLALEKSVTSHIEIAAEAVTSAGKTIVLPVEMLAELEDLVRQEYEPEFAAEVAIVEQTNLFVPHDKVLSFNIYTNEKTYASIISLRINWQPCEVAYTYRMNVPYVNDYSEMICTA